jgi:hypothetical protein
VHSGHRIVEHYGVDRILFEHSEPGRAIVSGEDLVARTLEEKLAYVKSHSLIVNAEDQAS